MGDPLMETVQAKFGAEEVDELIEGQEAESQEQEQDTDTEDEYNEEEIEDEEEVEDEDQEELEEAFEPRASETELRAELARLRAQVEASTAPNDNFHRKGAEEQGQQGTIPSYVTAEEFDEALEDVNKFNALMHKVVMANAPAIQEATITQMQTSMPGLIASQVRQQQRLQEAVQKFYASHPALANYKDIVKTNISKLEQEDPNLSLDDLMTKGADMTYKMLRLKQRATEDGTNPASTGLKRTKRKPQRSGSKDTRTRQQKLMDGLRGK